MTGTGSTQRHKGAASSSPWFLLTLQLQALHLQKCQNIAFIVVFSKHARKVWVGYRVEGPKCNKENQLCADIYKYTDVPMYV